MKMHTYAAEFEHLRRGEVGKPERRGAKLVFSAEGDREASEAALRFFHRRRIDEPHKHGVLAAVRIGRFTPGTVNLHGTLTGDNSDITFAWRDGVIAHGVRACPDQSVMEALIYALQVFRNGG